MPCRVHLGPSPRRLPDLDPPFLSAAPQENVVLGEDFDAERYRAAVEAAQLLPDLAILPNGDRTEIGDRGVTLSGGQKQRVSIARAMYAAPDVYLLDDPLSAVDSHVGAALFDKALRGSMRGKTVSACCGSPALDARSAALWLHA